MITWLFWNRARFYAVLAGVLTFAVVCGVALATLRLGGEAPPPALAVTTVNDLPTPAPVKMTDPIPAGIEAAESFMAQSGDPSTVTKGHVAVKQNEYLTEVRVQTTSGIVLVDLTPDGRSWAVLSVDWARP